jgi:hypothetical protein
MSDGQCVNQNDKLYSDSDNFVLQIKNQLLHSPKTCMHTRAESSHPLTALEPVLLWRTYDALDVDNTSPPNISLSRKTRVTEKLSAYKMSPRAQTCILVNDVTMFTSNLSLVWCRLWSMATVVNSVAGWSISPRICTPNVFYHAQNITEMCEEAFDIQNATWKSIKH